MGGDWGPLNARARGLGSRVLDRGALREAAGAASVGELAGRLGRAGFPPDGGELPATAEGLDRAVSRVTGWRLTLLHRFSAPVRRALPVVFEAEDRRSLRALLRGPAEGAAPERRLRGLVPTPGLPRSALEELAAAESRPELLGLVQEQGHPLGAAWADELGDDVGEAPGGRLFEAEAALDRAFADRSVSAARREEGVRRFAARRVDRANAWTLVLAGEMETSDPDTLHLPGGDGLPRERFASILAVSELDRRRQMIADALNGRSAPLWGDPAIPLGRLPDRLLAADVEDERDRARRDPLGPSPFLCTVLRFRAETRRLRRAIWGAATGAPASAVRTAIPS